MDNNVSPPTPKHTYEALHILPATPVAEMAERYFAIIKILDGGWPIDRVTDALSDAASDAQTAVFNTPSATFADVAAKLRMLAIMADAGGELTECVDLVNDVIDEWLRVYETEEAARFSEWRAA